MFINYSDYATKDFKCKSYLTFESFVGNIAVEKNVYNEWNFTARMASPNMSWNRNKTFAGNLIEASRNHLKMTDSKSNVIFRF